jgi:hypothetical protein
MARNTGDFELGKGTYQGSPIHRVPVDKVHNMYSWQDSSREGKPVFMKNITNSEFGNKYYNDANLEADIKANGQTTPIQVWVDNQGNHTIGDGHHRYVAAKNLGLTHVNAVILPKPESWDWMPKKKGLFRR